MKSLKKVVCLITALMCGIMFGLFALTACGEEEEPPYEPPKNCDVVLEYSSLEWDETFRDFIVVCDSYEEIQEELVNHGHVSWHNDKVQAYANEHSESKSFVVCLCTFGSYLGTYRIKEIEVDNEQLTMYIRYPWSPSGIIAAPDVMCSALFIAGVDKLFVANVTECEYEFV